MLTSASLGLAQHAQSGRRILICCLWGQMSACLSDWWGGLPCEPWQMLSKVKQMGLTLGRCGYRHLSREIMGIIILQSKSSRDITHSKSHMAREVTRDVKDWGSEPRAIISVFCDAQWIDTFGFSAPLHFTFLTEGENRCAGSLAHHDT